MFVKIAADVWVNVATAQSVRIGKSKTMAGVVLSLGYPDHAVEDRNTERDEFSFENEELANAAAKAFDEAPGEHAPWSAPPRAWR